MILQFLFKIIILITWPIHTLAQAQSSRNCTSKCGNVDIPFPFGIESGCYIDHWFAIDRNSNKPLIRSFNLELLEISLSGTMRVNHPVFYSCKNTPDSVNVYLGESPFVFSQTSNRFTGVGCNNLASMSSTVSVIGGCLSVCDESSTTIGENSCYGIKCCQTTIPSSLQIFNASIRGINDKGNSQQECQYAFLVDQQWFETNLKNPQDVEKFTHVPVVVDWGIQDYSFNLFARNKSTSYNSTSSCEISSNATLTSPFQNIQCKCHPGFQGNPYLLEGCQDIDECKVNPSICGSNVCKNTMGSFICYSVSSRTTSEESKAVVFLVMGVGLGVLLLILGVWWLVIMVKKRREIKLKEKYFRQNGGLKLQQQLTSSDGRFDRSTLFNSKELDKATDHFNVDRILGQGGQGTVYKGMLSDGKIVAIKKSRVSNANNVDEFINEVVILSQLNHRNVVKLLGCCLETEVPLLVYEFVPNGTLSEYLHDHNEDLPLTWNNRLRIAAEIAGALYYLHSAASIPIYHRDIKSTNILIDEKYRAKIADFGTSKSIAIDQTHVTTKVLGTFGYLDPEYFQSSQFIDKSDVYSFGVVLVELLTGQKAISSTRSEERRSLAAYFINSIEDNRLYDILDAQVIQMGKREEILIVANLAKRCLHLNGKERPTMKEVATELEAIRASPKDISSQQNYEEMKYVRTKVIEQWDSFPASTGSTFNISSPSMDKEPSVANMRLL